MAGTVPAWNSVSHTVTRCARERTPLLLHGETGTGKTTLVRAAHALTGASWAPIVVDAAAPGCDAGGIQILCERVRDARANGRPGEVEFCRRQNTGRTGLDDHYSPVP
ncbi:sigma 54-interacting transcriptional regulator [Streptomyces sp. NPDC059906]|uniref:sigma 54-interacting transcriptional regulator n=1 Tax=Streptomyces sp. NPDC059906 TaxID=3346997 RepID=UPI003652C9D2